MTSCGVSGSADGRMTSTGPVVLYNAVLSV